MVAPVLPLVWLFVMFLPGGVVGRWTPRETNGRVAFPVNLAYVWLTKTSSKQQDKTCKKAKEEVKILRPGDFDDEKSVQRSYAPGRICYRARQVQCVHGIKPPM